MTKKLTISSAILELQYIRAEFGDLNMISAKDAEGNGFRQLYTDDINLTRFDGEDTYIVQLTKELREVGFCEDDCNPDAPIVVCVG